MQVFAIKNIILLVQKCNLLVVHLYVSVAHHSKLLLLLLHFLLITVHFILITTDSSHCIFILCIWWTFSYVFWCVHFINGAVLLTVVQPSLPCHYEWTGVGSWDKLLHSAQRIQCTTRRSEVGKSFFCLISSEGQQPAKCRFKYILEEFGRKHRHISRENSTLFIWKLCLD